MHQRASGGYLPWSSRFAMWTEPHTLHCISPVQSSMRFITSFTIASPRLCLFLLSLKCMCSRTIKMRPGTRMPHMDIFPVSKNPVSFFGTVHCTDCFFSRNLLLYERRHVLPRSPFGKKGLGEDIRCRNPCRCSLYERHGSTPGRSDLNVHCGAGG